MFPLDVVYTLHMRFLRLAQATRVGAIALVILGFFLAFITTVKIPRLGQYSDGEFGTAYADAPACGDASSCTGDGEDSGCCADSAGGCADSSDASDSGDGSDDDGDA